MSRKLVIHIFHDDERSLNTATHVAERIRQVKDQQGVAKAEEFTQLGFGLEYARDAFVRYAMERATVISF